MFTTRQSSYSDEELNTIKIPHFHHIYIRAILSDWNLRPRNVLTVRKDWVGFYSTF